jgi:NtrC-family two-component system response regulator AlgB
VARLLVVDDEKSICSTIEAAMKAAGHQVEVADSGEMALALMRRNVPEILLTDLRMDGMSGLDLLGKAREYFPTVTVVIMTAFATIDTAVSAMKNGAYDYLVKPFTPEQLEHLVERIEEFRRLREENTKLRDQVDALSEPSSIQTENGRMQKVLDTARKVAVTDSTILITGESGTGKTLLAKLIHDGSARAKGPFAVVNCATLSENLLESELFGHVRGSFTGAVKDKMGRLQVADTGTVFLDEIGEISPSLQTKLLRFLQEREFERVGDTKTIRVDVRIIAATNKDLEREVREGRFREDLYFRLNVIELHMPSLRQRPEDILALAEQLLTRSFVATGRKPRPLSDGAKKAILAYGWPGNIRELKNALERAAILSAGEMVTVEDLPDRVLEHAGQPGDGLHPLTVGQLSAMTPSDVSLEELEKQHIQHVLSTAATLEEAASTLGINLSTLWRKRRRYGLE